MRASNTQLDQFARAGKIGFAAVAVAATAVTTAVTLLSKKAITLAVNFDESMRKVNTLAQLGQNAFKGMKDRVLDLSATLGKNAKEMGDALYQVISACFEGADAMEVLKTGVKMATAGMAGQLETVDALTTVLNAWNLSSKEAKRVADTFFLAIKYGKTTMGELAPTVGLVATMASQAGVSFEEVAAALSALTIVGVRTQRAVTGLNALFMAVVKPTDEARETAKALGFDLSVTALKTKGLVGFLKDLKEATGGNLETMVKLIPNIRAIRAVLPLTSSAAEKFTSTLRTMRTETGAMDEAFTEMNRAYSRQIKFFKTKWTKALIDFGETIWPMVGKWMDELSSPEMLQRAQLALVDLAEVITTALANIPLLISNISLNFETLQHMLLRAQKGHALFMRAISGWNTEVGILWKEVIEGINEDLGESDDKIEDMTDAFAKWHLEFQKLLPDYDLLREKIKQSGTATDDTKDKLDELSEIQIKQNIEDFKKWSYEGIEPVNEGIDETINLLHELSMRQALETENALKDIAKQGKKVSDAGVFMGRTLGTALGTIFDKSKKVEDIWKDLIIQLVQMAAMKMAGPAGFFASFVGGIMPSLFQEGGYIPFNLLPKMSYGYATQPTIPVVGEVRGEGEWILPDTKMNELIQKVALAVSQGMTVGSQRTESKIAGRRYIDEKIKQQVNVGSVSIWEL